jgi:phage FluMu protein Com
MIKGKAHMLHMCPRCKELSVIRRCYQRKGDNRLERLEYCLNKSCKYKLDLPFRVLESEVKSV